MLYGFVALFIFTLAYMCSNEVKQRCIKPYEKQQENGADFSAAPSSFPLSRRSGNNTVNRRVVFCFPLRRNSRNRFKKIKPRKAPSIRLTNKKKAGIIHIEFLNRYRDAVKI